MVGATCPMVKEAVVTNERGLCEYCEKSFRDGVDGQPPKGSCAVFIEVQQNSTQLQKDVTQWLKNGKTGKCPAFRCPPRR